MKEIDGIPMYTTQEIIAPVLRRLGLQALDPSIRDRIVSDIMETITERKLSSMRGFLSQDESRWISTLQSAYFQPFPGVPPLDRYMEWVDAKCGLLLAILRGTREDDYVIQHLLNYEDFCIEVLDWHYKNGAEFLVTIYELRGIDFFLYHYMGGETDAHKDAALFNGATTVVKALRQVERKSEADHLEKDIEARKAKIKDILKHFSGPEYNPAHDLAGRLRIASEKFWSDYLGVPVWRALLPESRSELADAFSTEYLLKCQVLTNWSNVTLMLCKVIEREVAHAIFHPWRDKFLDLSWTSPKGLTGKEAKRVESRLLTLRVLKGAAKDQTHAPTLGQLVFVAKFWKDDLMDGLSSVFIEVRRRAESRLPEISQHMELLASMLSKPVIEGSSRVTIPDIRNCSAHPRTDLQLQWIEVTEALKQALGRPPMELLKLVAITIGSPFKSA